MSSDTWSGYRLCPPLSTTPLTLGLLGSLLSPNSPLFRSPFPPSVVPYFGDSSLIDRLFLVSSLSNRLPSLVVFNPLFLPTTPTSRNLDSSFAHTVNYCFNFFQLRKLSFLSILFRLLSPENPMSPGIIFFSPRLGEET